VIRLVVTLVVIAALLLSLPYCGKKGRPFLPQENFDAKVADLKADQEESSVLLRGNLLFPENAANRVTGSRVYFAQYPSESPPCEGCPIEYQGYRSFGPEVIQDKRFFCRIPDISRNQVYFFKVALVGPGGVQGPSSDFVRVTVE
jgi:predicted small lipoprotein YifL